ncbi:transglycosylase domain-containing protein [Ohtaekwangia sp.]|uniref:transglycosylase domain-containing protein n=1 Tax=Ohtaekwangia sp. TaxID=2066019 RepID=UPI002F94718C
MTNRLMTFAKNIGKKILSRFRAQSPVKKILFTGAFLAGFFLVFFAALFILVWMGVFGRLPDRDELRAVENPLATEVYSADSVLLGKYFIQERSNIQYADIPQHLTDVVLATEDIRFFEHGAIDTRSLTRVFFKSILLQRESSGGGSTLTQQLAKNLYPRKNYWLFSTPINKMREMIVASRLEDIYDKPAILTLYLNTVSFGDNTFGIEAAAQRFYSVHARGLSVDQAAVLIGMLKSTYAYNPRIFPERSRQRRNTVLDQLQKYNKLSQAEADAKKKLPIKLQYNKITHHTGLAPYFREYIRQELKEWCRQHTKPNGDPYNLYTDGLKIYTTIDSRLQQYAEEAVNKQMVSLQKVFRNHWGKRDPWQRTPELLNEAIRKSDRYKSLSAEGLSHDKIMQVMKTPVLMSVLMDNGEQEIMMSPVDSIRHYLKFLQAGVLAMDPKQGAIRVWVGGINHHYFQYDHVRESTKRQIGSTFKPIVYAAALENGVDPCDFFSAAKVEYTNMQGWTPENTEDNYDLKYSLTGGLAYSVNTVSVRVLEQAGIDNTVALARRMGIDSDLPAVPAIALGAANISMMEMVRAYACFLNNGKRVEPFYITAIADRQGQVLEAFEPEQQTEQALSPEHAQMMVHMLKRTIDEGTGAGMRTRYGINNEMAGKTGTTQSNADGWFIAMTPNLVVGAWVGADDPRIRFRSTALGQGARTALPIVATFFQKVNADKELASISRAHFPELSSSQQRKISCDLYRSDTNVFQRIFGKKEKETKRAFGEKEKKKNGFFRRLFGKG